MKKGTLFKIKKDIEAVLVDGENNTKDIVIPSKSVVLMIKSKSYTADPPKVQFGKINKRPPRMVRLRMLFEQRMVEIPGISKEHMKYYFEKIKNK
jgi:hypothetical protein